jgi:hypothetical protein
MGEKRRETVDGGEGYLSPGKLRLLSGGGSDCPELWHQARIQSMGYGLLVAGWISPSTVAQGGGIDAHPLA